MNIIKFLKTLISSESIFHKDRTLNEVLEYQDNELLEINDVVDLSGRITASTTTICYSLPLNKNIPDDFDVIIEKLEATLRGTQGYLNNVTDYKDYCNLSGYSVTVEKVTSNLIGINIRKNSAFTNVSNNTPVVVSAIYKIRFKKK